MAAEVAAGAAGTLGALFAYNRGNYLFDTSLRYERFTSAREFGIAQTGMYRKDLRKLTEMVTKKMTIWSITASLCMALNIALFCAGRLGLHGASPPGWIMGLFLTNSASSFSFMILTMWLAMNASFRAQTTMVNLLTRKVRVPVPTLKQLDQARRLASEFEQQSWSDIFRVPYLANTGAPADSMPGDISPRHSSGRVKKGGVAASWVREEWETDRAGTIVGGLALEEMGPGPSKMEELTPEHFNLYAAAQKEWWPYEAYARVCMLYGFLGFFHGVAYFGLGHLNVEGRAFWVAYAFVFLMMTLLALLLRFDIIRGRNKKKEYLPNCQWLGPLACIPAAIAMSLEFRVEFSVAAIIVSYFLQFIAYGLQLVYQLRLLEVVLPDDWYNALGLEENVGFQWWPDSWKVPSSFQHVLYLVAPPQKLSPGQHDLVRELKEGTGGVEMVNPSATMSREEIASQTEYLDELFKWALREEIMDKLSVTGQNQVREIAENFQQARTPSRRKGQDDNFVRTLKESIGSLDAVMTREGITPQGLCGGGSGSDDSPPATPRSSRSGNSSALSPAPPVFKGGSSKMQTLGMKHAEPWKLTAIIVAAMCVGWVIMILGTFIEAIIGEQGLLTAPHWARPPMTRASKHPHETGTPYGLSKAAGGNYFLPEQLAWHEEKRGKEIVTIGRPGGYPGLPRRLEESPHTSTSGNMGNALQHLFAALPPDVAAAAKQMLSRAPTQADADALATVLSSVNEQNKRASVSLSEPAGVVEPISWPSFFEPKLLVCGPDVYSGSAPQSQRLAAISSRGFGATAVLGGTSMAVQFRLAGLSDLPPLVGASWHGQEVGHDKQGLLVISRGGHLLRCPGTHPPPDGIWPCGPMVEAPHRVPVDEGGRILAAAAGWLHGVAGAGGEPVLHAALVDERSPELVGVYVFEKAIWSPLGEIPVATETPSHVVGMQGAPRHTISLTFTANGEIFLGANGVLIRRRLLDGAVLDAPSAPPSTSAAEWQGVCALRMAKESTTDSGQVSGGGASVAHLLMRSSSGVTLGFGARPEVITFGRTPRSSDLILQ